MVSYLILAGLISIAVNPGVCMEPCNTLVTLRVEPAKDNYMVVITVQAPDSSYYSRSDLDYSNGPPKTVQFYYKNIPAGGYTVSATLYKHDGKTWVAGRDQTVLLVGGHQN